MKSIKTPNHPAYHWSTLWNLKVWVRGLYNSWWFCVHKLSMFIYLSMENCTRNGMLSNYWAKIFKHSFCFYVKIIFTYINIGKDLPGECLVVFQNVDITEFKTSLSQNLRGCVGRTQQQLILNIQGGHEQIVIHSTHPKWYKKTACFNRWLGFTIKEEIFIFLNTYLK